MQTEAFRAAREEGATTIARTATSDTDPRLQQSYEALPPPESDPSDTASLQALQARYADGTRKRSTEMRRPQIVKREDEEGEEEEDSSTSDGSSPPQDGHSGHCRAPDFAQHDRRRAIPAPPEVSHHQHVCTAHHV